MRLFQSVAAHYNFKSALEQMVWLGGKTSQQVLRRLLSERYGGEVTLYHKGRAALAEAVRLAIRKKLDCKVAISALTCYSVPQAVWATGAEVKYLDIQLSDLQFNATTLESAVERDKSITAVVIQNTLGIPADIKSIEEVAKKHNLVIIEDLAHSIGSVYGDGREVGTVGDLVMLSFGKEKALDVTNGGALIIRNRKLGKVVQPSENPSVIEQFRDRIYPMIGVLRRKLYGVIIGKYILSAAYRLKLARGSADGEVDIEEAMPGWQAALATKRLMQIDTRVKMRRENTGRIISFLGISPVKNAKLPGASLIRVPFVLEQRDKVVASLKEQGIYLHDIWYDLPVSPKRYYHLSKFDETACPNAVKISKHLFNIPTHENLSNDHIAKITKVIDRVTAK